ncbi:glycosyltransferase family 39 protein [bacterium]|nr:glycosyltransferase family 39 protein [bacterium]
MLNLFSIFMNVCKDKYLKSDPAVAILIFFCCFFITAATIKDIGITWDEPIGYFYGADLIVEFGKEVINHISRGDIKRIFSREFLDEYWAPPTAETQNGIYPNNHPPLCRYIPAVFWLLFNRFFGDVICYRLSSAFLFSLIAAFLFLLISRDYGRMAGLFASFSILLMPRVFGHAHIAASDMPLAAMWFLSVSFFWKALSSKRYKTILAIIYGFALITKFTALIIPIPLFLYGIYDILYNKKSPKAYLYIGLMAIFISPALMIALNPTFWHDPIKRILENHILLGLSHGKIILIAKYYFGTVYNYTKPWHMPLVMALITIPASLLITIFAGIVYMIKNRFKDRLLVLFLLNVLALFGVLMLPSANCYDGVRQFLSVFPFLAGISGVGFKWLVDIIDSWLKRLRFASRLYFLHQNLWLLMFALFLISPLMQLFAIHPYELAYYNECIGGVRGAFERGMETTYWLDAVNGYFLNYMNKNLPLRSRIYVWPPNLPHFRYLQNINELRDDFDFNDKDYDYLIILSRQGVFKPVIWSIYYNCTPDFSVTIDKVPLISIYKLPCSL